jgi:hypothetical protein
MDSAFKKLLGRLVGPFKEFGLAVGALYIVDRLLRLLSPRLGLFVYELMVQPITDKALLPSRLARNLSFVEIGPEHPDIARMPARPEIKAARFAQGSRCLGAYRKGELIGYVWFCFGRYAEDEVRCTYELADPERSVFDFDFYVLPEHRMGLAFTSIWHGANAYLHERGVRYTFSRMTRFNLASRRSHLRLGAKATARAMTLQLWNVELMLATCAPFVAMTWKPAQRTPLRLAPDVFGAGA